MVGRLFNLYPGEERRAGAFAILGYLWAVSSFGGLILTEALLLLHVGEEALPLSYIVTAGLFMLVTVGLLWVVEEFSPQQLLCGAAITGAAFYVYVSLHIAQGWVPDSQLAWVILKSVSYIFFVLLTMSYWAFVDEYHDLQDSKRLFVLFSSAIFLGSVTAGTLIGTSFLDAYQLALAMAALMLVSGVVALFVGRSQKQVYDDTSLEDRGADPIRFSALLRSIWSSPFTRLMLVTYLLMHIVQILTDYNVLSTFRQTFKQEVGFSREAADEPLTLFIGTVTAWVSCGNLLLGLFVYSRLVKRFGVSNMIAVLPACYLLLYAFWVMYTRSLVLAVAGFAIIEGLLYIVDDNTYNLCLNAVPSRMKNKIRILVESLFEPVGMVIAALLLWLPGFDSHSTALVLSAVCLVLALGMRRNYLPALYTNLQEHRLRFGMGLQQWFASMPPKERRDEERRLRHYQSHGDSIERSLATQGLTALEEGDQMESLLPQVERFASERSEDALEELLRSSLHFRPRQRRQAELALVEAGEEIQGRLLEVLADQQLPDRMRILAARVMGRIDAHELRKLLPRLIDRELGRARFCLYHHLSIAERYPESDLRVLVDALLTGFHSAIDCVVHFMGSISNPERAEIIALSLRSENEKVHADALEMLEEIALPGTFSQLEALLDDALPRSERLRLSSQPKLVKMDLDDVLSWLCTSSELLDQVVGFALQAELEIPGWRERLHAQVLINQEPIFQHFAKELLDPCPS